MCSYFWESFLWPEKAERPKAEERKDESPFGYMAEKYRRLPYISEIKR
jgi:hypothetical protein